MGTEGKDKAFRTPDTLHIKVHKARNLENLDDFGKSDPFVIVRFGSEETKSETINNSLNPEWEFHTQYHVDETSPETLQIKVMDDDYGKAELIGDLTLDVKTIMEKGQMLNQWMPLDKSKNGEVLVSTEYTNTGNSGFNVENNKPEIFTEKDIGNVPKGDKPIKPLVYEGKLK